jgi:hypothetical protein
VKHKCPSCKTEMANEDRRKAEPFTATNGATLTKREGQAPRVRCKCGTLVVFVKGSLS